MILYGEDAYAAKRVALALRLGVRFRFACNRVEQRGRGVEVHRVAELVPFGAPVVSTPVACSRVSCRP